MAGIARVEGIWGVLLVALTVSSCLFGGQTGESMDSSAGGAPSCDPARPIGFDEPASLGFSAADLVVAHGGDFQASASDTSAAFWQALGVVDAPAAPVGLTLSVAHEGGTVLENECARVISVEVVVSLDVAGGVIERSGIGHLVGDLNAATLDLELLPPVGGDGSVESVLLGLSVASSSVEVELWAGVYDSPVSLLFSGERP